MPLMVGMRGWKLNIAGEKIDKRWSPGFFRRIFGAKQTLVRTEEGHDMLIRLSDVVCVEHMPVEETKAKEFAEKEKKRLEDEAKAKAEEDMKTWSHCRKCNTHSRREFDFCPKCGSALVKKEMPKPTIPQGV